MNLDLWTSLFQMLRFLLDENNYPRPRTLNRLLLDWTEYLTANTYSTTDNLGQSVVVKQAPFINQHLRDEVFY